MAPQRQEAPSSPAGVCSARGRYSPAVQAKTKTSGTLAKGYEGRFGSPSLTTQDSTSQCSTPASARPSRKPGVTKFTDAKNPSAREASKKMNNIEDFRSDTDRAGGRTRNPGMIPRSSEPRTDMAGSEKRVSDDGRPTYPFAAHQYSTSPDWRPGKRCPDFGTPSPTPATSARSPRCSEGMQSAFPDTRANTASKGVLGNYLNDMKKTQKSLRSVAPQPSVNLQRMNDERVKLPSQRRLERNALVSSCRTLPNTTLDVESEHTFSISQDLLGGTRPQSARIRRSFSCDPRIQRSAAQGEMNEREDNYGFTRKREVRGGWTSPRQGTPTLLHHEAGHNDPQPVSPRRSERLERKADERFVEMVAHMKAANPEQRLKFEHFKTRSEHSVGLISHNSSPG